MAIAAQLALTDGASTLSLPILQDSIKYEQTIIYGSSKTYALKFSFKNLKGKFINVDTPQRFNIRDRNGIYQELIYRTTFYEGNKVVRLLLTDAVKNLSNKTLYLYYRYGKNPVCNIVLTSGMGLLASGPIATTL